MFWSDTATIQRRVLDTHGLDFSQLFILNLCKSEKTHINNIFDKFNHQSHRLLVYVLMVSLQ